MIPIRNKIIRNSWWIITQLVLFAAVEFLINGYIHDNNINTFIALCWTADIVFIIEIALLYWKRKKFFDPITIFAIIIFLFTFGQIILYSIGVVPNRFNVIEYTSMESIIEALKFAVPGYIMFVFGCVMGSKSYISRNEDDNNVKYIDKKAESVACLFIAIGFFPFLLTIANNVRAIFIGGYNYYYNEGVRLSNYISFFSYYFYVGLFLLSGHNKETVRKTCFIILLIIVIIYALCGDRGTALSLMLSSYLVYQHYGRKKAIGKPFITILLIIVGLASVSIIENWRMSANRGISFINIVTNSLVNNNILFSTLTNLGGTIYALANVIMLIPSTHEFIIGGSYLASLVLLIPSPLRIGLLGAIDKMEILSSPASWLMNTLGLSYGPGFTPFAEAYLNFGYLGIPFMFILGFFFTKLFTAEYDELHNTSYCFQIFTFFILAMSARGSFNYVFAFWIRYTLIPLFFIKHVKFKIRVANND